MTKHAYLILAHNDLPLLQTLLSCLDDDRNDIYVHWDKKSGDLPELSVAESGLFFTEERVSVNWGAFSMVEAEYHLFEKAAQNGPYAYYHLLSGADLPIKSQDYIHSVCDEMRGTEFVAFSGATQKEIDYRSQHYFLFPEEFRSAGLLKRSVRRAFIRLQDLAGYRRSGIRITKGAQWCSITQEFAEYVISQKTFVRKLFNHTFCPDEMFIQTLCINSPFGERVVKTCQEFEGNRRFIKWVSGELLPVTMADVPALKESDRWFARKFSSSDKELIDLICKMNHE